MGARGGCAWSRGTGFSACRVSHPALTNGYAHPKDGRLPIDQLDSARWLVPKKRGLTHPPFDHPARNVMPRSFIYFSFFPNFIPLPCLLPIHLDPSSPLGLLFRAAYRSWKKFSRSGVTSHPSASPSPRHLFSLLTFSSPRIHFSYENSTRETRARAFPVVQFRSRDDNKYIIHNCNNIYGFQ